MTYDLRLNIAKRRTFAIISILKKIAIFTA
ncbi:MAG: hypothetical protein K0Q79_385 [Flavipsychrobacter sp.]|jgi:hypothetical protein|nr:hypothetical protein [Flavipsychrobacter sp.]